MYRTPAEWAEFNKRVEGRGGTAAMIVGSVARELGLAMAQVPANTPALMRAINERFEYLERQREQAMETAGLPKLSRRHGT